MIPSRGLRWSGHNIGIGGRRLQSFPTRSFSSSLHPNEPSKPISLVSGAGALGRKTALRPQVVRRPYVLQNGPSLRFQSTATSVPGTTEAISTNIDKTAGADSSSSLGSLDNAIDLSLSNLQDIPEQVGYLKALGLDYGFGPTGAMQWVIEHVHVYAGTPWWASIVLTAVLARVICFYPYLAASDNAARIAIVQPMFKPITEKMKDATRRGDTAETMKLRAELQMINKRAGVSYVRAFIPIILQGPIGFGTFFLLRAMSTLPVPGLETGGVLWFHNLTIPDPYYIIPVATAGVLHWLLRRGGEAGTHTNPEMLRIISYFLPAMSLAFTWWLPASLQLSFFITGVLSFLQADLFRWKPFRKYFKLTPMPKRSGPFGDTPAVESSPYQPRIITAQKTQPSTGSYEPPRGASTPTKPTVFSGMKGEVVSAIEAAKASARKTLKSAREIAGQESKDGKRTKRQLQHANEYERKRKLEERKRFEEFDQERRARKEKGRETYGG